MIVVAWKGSDDMPLDDFASKQELQKVKQELAEIKQQNQEVIETLKSLDNSVKQGYIKVRGGEDIPKMSELKAEMNRYATYVQKRTAEIDQKLDSYGNISKSVSDELSRQVRPQVQKFLANDDRATAEELKQNRIANLMSVLASVGLFIGGTAILLLFQS